MKLEFSDATEYAKAGEFYEQTEWDNCGNQEQTDSVGR